MLKVLLVGAYHPPYGGVQVHLVQLEEYLESLGHSCFIINMGKNKALQNSKIVSPRSALGVAYELFRRRDHVCHLHFGGVLHVRLLMLGLLAHLLFYKRSAITVHSGGLSVWQKPKSLLSRLLFRGCFGLCWAVICVNPKIAQYFKELGVKAERIYVLSAFAYAGGKGVGPLPEPVGSFVAGKKPLVCVIGLLEPEYDLEILMRVFRRFVREHPNGGLVIIGSGSLRSKLDDTIAELGVRSNVILAGDLGHSETLKILGASDCYVRATRYDGDCISLKEAIRLGVPAIATDTGLRPQEAVLFPIGDEESLLKRLEETASYPSRQKMTSFESDLSSLAEVERILAECAKR